MIPPGLSIPPLDPPFDHALVEALEYIFDSHEDVVAVNFAGSVAAGEADQRSDLDLFVIIEGDLRHRDQRVFSGVPCEMFFNNEERARGYFAESQEEGRTQGLALVAFGHIIYDPSSIMARLRQEALDIMEKGPTVGEQALTARRYGAVDHLENALDIADRDPVMSRILATEAVSQAIAVWFVERGGWTPRAKDRLQALRDVDPEAAGAVEQFIETGDITDAESAIGVLLGVSGFFEWESIPEP